jgi:di/tricarboxylate transporter
MSGDIIFLFVLLGVTILLFVSDRVRLDVVAIMVIIALMISGILTPTEALAGFGDPVVILIAALFVVGESLYRTGIAFATGNWLMRVAGEGENRLTVLLMLVVALLSAFMSSTGAVAIFIPVALTLASKTGVAASRIMMPMAIASLIGGMLTLIGTPPNMVVSTQLERSGLTPFNFFDFTPAGLVILLVGVAYILTLGQKLIPTVLENTGRPTGKSIIDLVTEYNKKEKILHAFKVPESSVLNGISVADTHLREAFGIILVGYKRKLRLGEQNFPISPMSVIQHGDLLYTVSERDDEKAFAEEFELEEISLLDNELQKIRDTLGLVEVMLTPTSSLIGKSIREVEFRDRFHLNVMGINRKGTIIDSNPLDSILQFGDTLLIGGGWQPIRELMEQKEDFIVLTLPEEFSQVAPQGSKAPLALIILLVMLVMLTFNILPTVTTVLIAALMMGFAGCISMKQAYKSISWESLVLIAGMLPMATALEKTGAIQLIIENMVAMLGDAGPRMIMAALFVLTSVFSQFISNTATTVLIAPIATGIAVSMGVSPYPLVMMVAIAASTSFSTPVASPVNMLIMGPGGYRFADFAKVGVPLQIIILFVSLFILPILFPLYT